MLKKVPELKVGPEIYRRAKEAVFALVSTIPGAHVEFVDNPKTSAYDFEAVIHRGGRLHRLRCEVRSRAWPNELHGVAHQFQHDASQRSRKDWTPVLIAPYFSPQAIDLCARLGLSWADLSGNCQLSFGDVYIRVHGSPNPERKGRGTASLYSPQSSRVVHALLLEPRRKWTTTELARAAGVSLGQVSSVRKLLEINSWIRAEYGETTLTEPRQLLDDWSNHYEPRRKSIRMYSLDPPAQLEARIASTLPGYALTEFSAAQRYAPFTRHQRVAAYVKHWGSEQASALGLKAGDGAANVTIYESGADVPFVETVNGSRCASPIQTYLDLRLLAGRGQDAAEHLLESVIEPRWK